ncbi:MAG: hypothetical protein ABI867_13225 [Kofleriaceae bacterium]
MTTTTTRDRRVESSKESLVARVEELGRRFEAAKHKFDIGARIEQHPLAAVGIAIAAGAVLGMLGGGHRNPGDKRSVGGLISAGLGALVIGALKDFALSQVSGVAKEWIEGKIEGQQQQHDVD